MPCARSTGTDAERARARALLADAGLVADRTQEYRTGGPMHLGERLMPDTVYGARSPLHAWLNDWHLREANPDVAPQTAACAAPRGHGKTTAGVELPALWHAANCTRRFQVIISNTQEQANARIAAIKAMTENTEGLTEVYPKLRPAFEWGEPGTWREADLVFACGCRIAARGAGAAMRGLKHRDQRPDLIYFDDLEDETSVSTAFQIKKRHEWLSKVALALGSPVKGLSVLWVGTILSRDALLNLATGAALDEGQQRPAWAQGWVPRVFRAEVEGSEQVEVTVEVEDPDTGAMFTSTRLVGEPMWSEMTREKLAKIAATVGPDSYAAEYMSDPVDASGGMLPAPLPAVFVNPDAPPQQRVVRCPDGTLVPVAVMTRAAALDPQYSEGGSDPDLASVSVVGQAGARTFVLDSWIGRDRHGQAGRLVQAALKWGCFAGAVEVNAAQVVTADQAAAMGHVPILREHATEGKAERALGLSVRLGPRDKRDECRVFLLAGEGHNDELPSYMERFPHGRYKDPVDALVMAVNVATRVAPAEAASLPSAGPTRYGV